jgi:predicted kinase
MRLLVQSSADPSSLPWCRERRLLERIVADDLDGVRVLLAATRQAAREAADRCRDLSRQRPVSRHASRTARRSAGARGVGWAGRASCPPLIRADPHGGASKPRAHEVSQCDDSNLVTDTRLIVLRGPSGAGKSSVGARLLESPRPTALIEQDAYRFIFNLREGEAYSKTVRQMIRDNALAALSNGFDVILEGIFKAKGYRDVFATMFREHPRNNFLFYFDVSLEETFRRHRGRAKASLFTELDMRGWYKGGDLLGYDFEHVIREDSGLDATVDLIRRATVVT